MPTVLTVLLPVALMLLRALGELLLDEGNTLRTALDVVGAPVVALLAGVVVAMFTMGVQAGFARGEISATLGGSLGPIAGILLIVAAGGGFKQTLINAGVGDGHRRRSGGRQHLRAGARLAGGGRHQVGDWFGDGRHDHRRRHRRRAAATDLGSTSVALLALAIGAGSLFFSHVNDAGFWLVKEYFGLTVGQTIKSWSVMETIISVVGLIGVLLLNLVL